ncbi:MAG: cytochrome b N-terminal domain-containing protein [Verrucomicrobia bacterium]|nr:cytochrome b N-terminal domain-containing protein [Verrucomicrobiota bacterium]
MKTLLDWLDSRTGIRHLTREALLENIPGGGRWRYVWGSALTFCLLVQFITGAFLWTAYSPGALTAWESVYYIQNQITGGWFLRGLHHFTAQIMVVLLVLHLMQVVIDGAYKAPREVNFWFGLGLLMLTLAMALTGYLLPWDQKGYWATKVATNIAAVTPFFGEQIQRLIVGGADYGNLTLTRFFALHAGFLPAGIVLLVVGHIALFRRHGITAKKPLRRPDARFWPDQVLMDAVAALAVLCTVVFLTLAFHGAELSAPADPSEPYPAARPEWYFLFLFQFLKYFPGHTEVWGAIVIPTVALLILAAMPLIGRWQLGHRFNLGFLVAIGVGAALLTLQARRQDQADPAYLAARTQAERDAHRVAELARAAGGIPDSGAVTLLREDPLTQGPRLFAQNCASCHRYDGHDGLGNPVTDPASAPDLKGFGSRAWLAGLLDPARVDSAGYLGGTKFKEGKMVKFVKQKVARYDAGEQAGLVKVIAAVSAEAQLPLQAAEDQRDAAILEEGRLLLRSDFSCTDCHAFRKPDEDATAPDLTGWGSREWISGIISDPSHERFYGKRNDRMPAFQATGQLEAQSIGLLADWLRGDWYRAPGANVAR